MPNRRPTSLFESPSDINRAISRSREVRDGSATLDIEWTCCSALTTRSLDICRVRRVATLFRNASNFQFCGNFVSPLRGGLLAGAALPVPGQELGDQPGPDGLQTRHTSASQTCGSTSLNLGIWIGCNKSRARSCRPRRSRRTSSSHGDERLRLRAPRPGSGLLNYRWPPTTNNH
jgi:hypothetical protein